MSTFRVASAFPDPPFELDHEGLDLDLGRALADLEAGAIDGFMKLAPVMHWLTRARPKLRVVQQDLTVELICASVRLGNTELKHRLEAAQRAVDLEGLGARWLTGMGAEVLVGDQADSTVHGG